MADLNSLLRWAVENSTPAESAASAPAGEMKLTYIPAKDGVSGSTAANAGVATLHSSDSQPASLPAAPTPSDVPETSTPAAPPKKTELNSEIIDLILGKSDSVTMREKMEIATNESADVEERVEALDDLEMLIELIDNANNMAVLKLWQPLLELLDSRHQEIVRHALWIMGTATQNNLKGQAALFLNNALPKILALTAEGVPAPTRAKAVYALSSAVKHWPLAAEALSEDSNRGFAAIAAGVADADRVIRRKVAFLLGTLVLQARDKWNTDEMPGEVRTLLAEHAKAAGGDIFADLITSLAAQGVLRSAVAALAASAGSTDADDVEYEENLVRALANAASAGGLTPEEKAQVAAIWAKWGAEGQAARGLEGQEANDISDALA